MSRVTEAVEYLLNLPQIEEIQENQKHSVTIRMNFQTLATLELIAEKIGQTRASTINLILDNACSEVAEVCRIEDEEIFVKHMDLLKKQK